MTYRPEPGELSIFEGYVRRIRIGPTNSIELQLQENYPVSQTSQDISIALPEDVFIGRLSLELNPSTALAQFQLLRRAMASGWSTQVHYKPHRKTAPIQYVYFVSSRVVVPCGPNIQLAQPPTDEKPTPGIAAPPWGWIEDPL